MIELMKNMEEPEQAEPVYDPEQTIALEETERFMSGYDPEQTAELIMGEENAAAEKDKAAEKDTAAEQNAGATEEPGRSEDLTGAPESFFLTGWSFGPLQSWPAISRAMRMNQDVRSAGRCGSCTLIRSTFCRNLRHGSLQSEKRRSSMPGKGKYRACARPEGRRAGQRNKHPL